MSSSPDFTADHYDAFLRQAKEVGFEFLRVKDHLCARNSDASVVLRHDVDFCLESSLQMAEREAAVGVTSTYFVLLRSPFYNPLSPRGRTILKRLIELGHEVALHWDGSLLPQRSEAARAIIFAEATLLGDYTGEPVVSVAQHFPTTNGFLDLSNHFSNDTYSKDFQQRYIYASDSSMTWRNWNLPKILAARGHFHLLIHPVWWMRNGKTQEDKIIETYRVGSESLKVQFDDFLVFMRDCLAKRAALDQSFKERIG